MHLRSASTLTLCGRRAASSPSARGASSRSRRSARRADGSPSRSTRSRPVGCRGDRRHARALVDQGDLAEIVAGLQGRVLLAADETVASPDSITKKAAPPEPSLDDRLALGEAPLLEQPRDLCELVLRRGRRRAARAAGLRSARPCMRSDRSLAAPVRGSPGGDRAALQQVQRPAGDRPFDVARRAVDLLAAVGEPVELRELVVVEAEPLDELGGDRLLDRAAVRAAARTAIFFRPGVRSSTSPERSTRKWSGITSPATTASPSPSSPRSRARRRR